MPPLSRFDTLPSIHSWWSDSNPPGATISIHAVAKPLMRYMYHKQAREFVRTNQNIALSRNVMENLASYLTYKYVSHGTKALVLEELAARSNSDVDSDAAAIVSVLRGEDDTFSEFLKSPNTEVKSWTRELLTNLAHKKSAWMSSLPWRPCTSFVDLLGEQESCIFALHALFRICESPAGAEAIVGAQTLRRIVDLNLLNFPDFNTRMCVLATLDHLSQHKSVSLAVLEVDPSARLCRTRLNTFPKYYGHFLPSVKLDVRRQLHRQAEMVLKKAKAEMDSQFKVLLFGSCDSGKSTMLNQMRLIHNMPFSGQELRSYRQIVFDNLIRGLKYLLDALPDMGLKLPSAYTHVYPEDDPQGRGGYVRGWAPGECGGMSRIGDGLDEEGVRANALQPDVDLIESTPDLCDGESFPLEYLGPLQRLWDEEVVSIAWARRNEIALQENLHYFFSDLHRLFDPAYVPSEQDILHTRTRTKGITETTFKGRDCEILMIDVDGQKSERRKWIHCFQEVTSIVFFVSLSWYDRFLVGDRDANQMQDAMTFWESICHSKWFQRTSIILVFTENEIFEEKIKRSNIQTFFPDFDGEPGDAVQGRNYFKKRFSRLAHKAGRTKSREIYVHTMHTTDTELLRVITAAVEDTVLRLNIERADIERTN